MNSSESTAALTADNEAQQQRVNLASLLAEIFGRPDTIGTILGMVSHPLEWGEACRVAAVLAVAPGYIRMPLAKGSVLSSSRTLADPASCHRLVIRYQNYVLQLWSSGPLITAPVIHVGLVRFLWPEYADQACMALDIGA